MHRAVKVAIDRPTNKAETKTCAQFIKSIDRLLIEHEIEPVTWTADQDEDQIIFLAYIPADCLPELDAVSDVIAGCYEEFNQHNQ